MNETTIVAEAVRPYLRDYQLNGIAFDVLADKTQKVDQWWRVPVQPSRWPESLFPVYETLAIIQEKLEDEHGLDVLLSLGEPVNTDMPEVIPA